MSDEDWDDPKNEDEFFNKINDYKKKFTNLNNNANSYFLERIDINKLFDILEKIINTKYYKNLKKLNLDKIDFLKIIYYGGTSGSFINLLIVKPCFWGKNNDIPGNIYHCYLSKHVEMFFRILVGLVIHNNIDKNHMKSIFYSYNDNDIEKCMELFKNFEKTIFYKEMLLYLKNVKKINDFRFLKIFFNIRAKPSLNK